MKKLIFLSFILTSVFTTNDLLAQGAKHANAHKNQGQKLSPDERVAKETAEATTRLTLNAEQKVKWEQASRERITANTPLKEKMNGSTTPEERETIKSQVKANNQKFDEQVKGFLNADQMDAYQKFKQERKEEMHNHKHGGEK